MPRIIIFLCEKHFLMGISRIEKRQYDYLLTLLFEVESSIKFAILGKWL